MLLPTRLCAVLLLAGIGPLAAEEYHFRRAVDIRMACHPRPDLGAPAGIRISLGAKIWVTRQTQVNGVTWYNDGLHARNPAPLCWVYGPATVELDGEPPETGWLAMLDHILARSDAKFAEYVAVDNALLDVESPADRKAIDDSGRIQFRRLQMIERMLEGEDAHRNAVERDPLKKAWILAHRELVHDDEPGGRWLLSDKPYLALLARYKGEAWAEEIAWAYTELARGGDECDAECALETIVEQPLWYLSRYPAGAHAGAAMKRAAELAALAAGMACSDSLPPDWDTPVKHDVAEKIRDGLREIELPGKQHILRDLDAAERKCAKAR
jgi:hypothetical protein